MHVTITKCLDYWFSVDVATSMLVDKRKSVPLRFGKIFLANFAKTKKQKNKQTNKNTVLLCRCVNQQPETRLPCHFPAPFGTLNVFEGVR